MTSTLSRRDFLRSAGALVVGFSFRGAVAERCRRPPRFARRRFRQISSTPGSSSQPTAASRSSAARWNWAPVCRRRFGRSSPRSSTCRFDRIAWVQGDSDRTVDQGSTVGSQSVKRGGAQLRQAAAEARAALLEMASAKLGAPVAVARRRERRDLRAAELRIATRDIRRARRRQAVRARRQRARRRRRRPSEYTVVGKPVPRVELPAKMTGGTSTCRTCASTACCTAASCVPRAWAPRSSSVDDSALRDIPGARVVRKGDWLGVVAEREEDAMRAARRAQDDVECVRDAAGDGRAATTRLMKIPATDRVVTRRRRRPGRDRARSEDDPGAVPWPFQMHASIGASCGVADVKPDFGDHLVVDAGRAHAQGQRSPNCSACPPTACTSSGPRAPAATDTTARTTPRPMRRSCRRRSASRCACQWSRADEHGWEPKGVAMVMDVAGGLDENGKIMGWDYAVWTPTHSSRPERAGRWVDELRRRATHGRGAEHRAAPSAAIATRDIHIASEHACRLALACSRRRCALRRSADSARRRTASPTNRSWTSWRLPRAPIRWSFACGISSDPRAIAVVRAVARLAKWTPPLANATEREQSRRPGAASRSCNTKGRKHTSPPSSTSTSMSRSTRVRVTRVCVAHDCGLIVNPDGLRNQIEGNVIQGDQPHAQGVGRVRPLARDESRLAVVPNSHVRRGAGVDRDRADRSSGAAVGRRG